MLSFRRGLTLGTFILGPLAWLLVTSCGDGSRPPPATEVDGTAPVPDVATDKDSATGTDGGAKDATTKDADAGDALGTPDAADGASGDGEAGPCKALDAGGPVLPETVVAGFPPAALGGQLFPGEYWLTERDFYPAATDPPDAGSSRANIVVQSSYFFGATTLDIVEGQGPLGATTVVTSSRSGTYKLGSATQVTIDEACPGTTQRNVPFTVSGDELWLFPTQDRRDVYTQQ